MQLTAEDEFQPIQRAVQFRPVELLLVSPNVRSWEDGKNKLWAESIPPPDMSHKAARLETIAGHNKPNPDNVR
jgi:hypothetical protein